MRHVCLIALPAIAVGQCPLSACSAKQREPQQDGANSLLQVGEPNEPLPVDTESLILDGGLNLTTFDPAYHPGKFECTSCDVSSCHNCNNIICDLSSCTPDSGFYEQECWCRRKQDLRDPQGLWQFNEDKGEFLLDHSVVRTHCDDGCGEGICSDGNLVCNTREDGCKPWFWCDDVLPPLHAPKKEWPVNNEWLQLSSRVSHKQANRIGAAIQQEPAAAEAESTPEQAQFSFVQGRWSCSMASHGPVSPGQLQPAYVVLEAGSCTLSEPWSHECSCWDQVAYENYEDPKSSAFFCDAGCSAGPCDLQGMQCAQQPPPPKVRPPVPPVDFEDEDLEQGAY